MNEILRKDKYYYKVVNSFMGIPGVHKYKKGENIFKYPEGKSIDTLDGMFFTDIKNIFNYCNYGPIVLELIIPEDAKIGVYPEKMSIDSVEIPGWCADKIIVNKILYLTNPDDVIYLIDKGADISCDNYLIIK